MARIAIVGVGAIGGVLAGLLETAGSHQLTLCTRRPLPSLVIETPDGSVTVRALNATTPAEAQPVDGAAQTNGRHHVVQRPPLGRVIVHVVGGDQAHPHRGGEIVEQRQAAGIVAAEQHGAGEVAAVAKQAGECAQALAEGGFLGPARRQDDG